MTFWWMMRFTEDTTFERLDYQTIWFLVEIIRRPEIVKLWKNSICIFTNNISDLPIYIFILECNCLIKNWHDYARNCCTLESSFTKFKIFKNYLKFNFSRNIIHTSIWKWNSNVSSLWCQYYEILHPKSRKLHEPNYKAFGYFFDNSKLTF